MGARFSVDSLLASLRARPERSAADLNRREDLPLELRPVVSLAVLALLLQVSVIYYFNVVHKSGVTWRDGSAVHYALHQDRLVTWLGWRLREQLTPALSQVMTYAALAVEAVVPVLVLNPFGWRVTRRLAAFFAVGLHLGFAALMNLGLFSFNMIGFFLPLIPATDWERLARLFAPRTPSPRTVYVDEGNGLCFLFARVLARLDPHRKLRFAPASELPHADNLVVEDGKSGLRLHGSRALAAALTAIPFGRPLGSAVARAGDGSNLPVGHPPAGRDRPGAAVAGSRGSSRRAHRPRRRSGSGWRTRSPGCGSWRWCWC